jgi:hypothetical protein
MKSHRAIPGAAAIVAAQQALLVLQVPVQPVAVARVLVQARTLALLARAEPVAPIAAEARAC